MYRSTRLQPVLVSMARRMSSTTKSHGPPKKIYGLNGRYAMATYTAASKVSIVVLEGISHELNMQYNM
jgi:hypothetical protein